MLSPTQPVCRVSQPCSAPLPNRQVRIEHTNGTVDTTVTTNAQGRFSVALAPGNYVVQVVLRQGLPGLRQDTPGNVTIAAGKITTITIVVDSGIR
jgi:hypothetical protein